MIQSHSTGQGYSIVDGRIFYWVRYLDWLVTTPLLLMDLAALAGVSAEDTMMTVILDVLMILAGLAGGLTSGFPCFVLWVLGCIFFVPIVYDLAVTFRSKASAVGPEAGATYSKLTALTVIVWSAYPVVFFFAEYSGILSVSMEVLAYGIMDVTAKCLFGFILLTSRKSLEQGTAAYGTI